MKKSPLQLVQEQFETKEKLVAAVQKLATDELWVDRVNPTKGLESVSNTKLLKLHASLTEAKSQFGSRDKLVAAVAELENRAKDDGYKVRLQKFSVPRLLELHRAAKRRSARSTKAAS